MWSYSNKDLDVLYDNKFQFVDNSTHKLLFTPQCIDRIGACCFYRLVAHGNPCHQKSKDTGKQVNTKSYFSLIGIAAQPPVHTIPGNGYGDYECNQNQLSKIF